MDNTRIPVVVVCGKYNDTDVLKVLANMRRGIDKCVELSKLRVMPYCPWIDYVYALKENLPMEIFKSYSLALIHVCDAVYMLNNWIDSSGAIVEWELAEKLEKPIFYERRPDEFLTWIQEFNERILCGQIPT